MKGKKKNRSPSCCPEGSEVGAKPRGSIKEGGFSHPGVGEAGRERRAGLRLKHIHRVTQCLELLYTPQRSLRNGSLLGERLDQKPGSNRERPCRPAGKCPGHRTPLQDSQLGSLDALEVSCQPPHCYRRILCPMLKDQKSQSKRRKRNAPAYSQTID